MAPRGTGTFFLFAACAGTALALWLLRPCPARSHQRNVAEPLVYYMHMHKAGGSTMCNMARHNNMVANCNNNCNLQDPALLRSLTLVEQRHFALTTPYEFVANEMELPDELETQHFRYFTTLRHPLSRYMSAWNHYGDGHGTSFHEWVVNRPDNYYVRHMCGPSVAALPNGAITEEHLFRAMARLTLFEGVMIVEHYAKTADILRSKLGWEHTDTTMLRSGTRHNSAPTDDDGQGLEHLYRWDLKFYEFAVRNALQALN